MPTLEYCILDAVNDNDDAKKIVVCLYRETYCLTDHAYRIFFNDQTTMDVVDGEQYKIPISSPRFHVYAIQEKWTTKYLLPIQVPISSSHVFLQGIYIFNLGKTWEKLQMAGRIIVAIENPQDIIVQSARPYGQRAVLKFAQYTGANAIAGRHTPGTFTNQMQTSFSEPRLLILTDPRTDHPLASRVFLVDTLLRFPNFLFL
ncbi:unnamed protein product [Cochlearia groenlandica]